MQKKKIRFVLDTFPSLSETFLYTLLQNLSSQYELVICARKKGNSPHDLSFISKVYYLPNENHHSFLKLVTWIYCGLCIFLINPSKTVRFFKYLKYQYKNDYKVVFNESFRIFPLMLIYKDLTYFSFGGLAAKYMEYIRFEGNCFFSLRGSDINIEPLLNENYKSRLKEAITLSTGVHCVCDEIKQDAQALIGQKSEKIQTIYTSIASGYVFEITDRKQNKNIKIVSVGRLDWKKGLEHGLMAINYLKEKGYNFEWTIIGDGNYKTPIQWAIRDLNLENHVFLLGSKSQSEIKELLLKSNIYFHPSVSEGISNSVIEAMSIGLPVVVSDVGGMKEAIPTDEYGYLVPARDWREMAVALENLMNNPDKRIQIGETASKFVKSKFSSTQQIEGFLKLFSLVTKQDNS